MSPAVLVFNTKKKAGVRKFGDYKIQLKILDCGLQHLYSQRMEKPDPLREFRQMQTALAKGPGVKMNEAELKRQHGGGAEKRTNSKKPVLFPQ